MTKRLVDRWFWISGEWADLTYVWELSAFRYTVIEVMGISERLATVLFKPFIPSEVSEKWYPNSMRSFFSLLQIHSLPLKWDEALDLETMCLNNWDTCNYPHQKIRVVSQAALTKMYFWEQQSYEIFCQVSLGNALLLSFQRCPLYNSKLNTCEPNRIMMISKNSPGMRWTLMESLIKDL